MIPYRQLFDLYKYPVDLRWDTIKAMLIQFGYVLKGKRGSHMMFKKAGTGSILVVVHNNKVKKWYVKRMAAILLDQIKQS